MLYSIKFFEMKSLQFNYWFRNLIKETHWLVHFVIRLYEFGPIKTAHTKRISWNKGILPIGFYVFNKRRKLNSRVAGVCIKVQIQNKTDFKQPTNSCSIHWNDTEQWNKVYENSNGSVDVCGLACVVWDSQRQIHAHKELTSVSNEESKQQRRRRWWWWRP